MPLVKQLMYKFEGAILDCLKADRVTPYQCSATPHLHLGYYYPPPPVSITAEAQVAYAYRYQP